MQPARNKRQKELARLEKQKEKSERAPSEAGVDPDIAGITPGPQPVPDWMTE